MKQILSTTIAANIQSSCIELRNSWKYVIVVFPLITAYVEFKAMRRNRIFGLAEIVHSQNDISRGMRISNLHYIIHI